MGWTNWICFQIEHWKGKISNFGVEKPGRHYLSQMITVNLTGVINHWYHVTPDTMWWDIHQTHKLGLVMSETPDTRWGVFCNNWPVSSEAPGSWKTVLSLRNKEVASLVAHTVKNLPAVRKTPLQPLSWEDPLEEEMATYSSILAWRILWTEETGRLVSVPGEFHGQRILAG